MAAEGDAVVEVAVETERTDGVGAGAGMVVGALVVGEKMRLPAAAVVARAPWVAVVGGAAAAPVQRPPGSCTGRAQKRAEAG